MAYARAQNKQKKSTTKNSQINTIPYENNNQHQNHTHTIPRIYHHKKQEGSSLRCSSKCTCETVDVLGNISNL